MTEEIQQTKVLSITDASATTNVAFIEKIEQEKAGIKLYYYMWLSRLYIFFTTVSLMFFMACSLSLFKIAPKVFVEPFMIISQDNSANVVRAEAMTDNMASKDKILEIFMRHYVVLRNTIIPDQREMETRWMPGGMLNFYSSYKIFKDFSPNIKEKIRAAMQKEVSRSVQIDSIGKVGGAKSPIWKVTFRTYDIIPQASEGEEKAMKLKTLYWTASISAKFYDNRMFLGRRLINPLGFTVVDYSQAQVGGF
ncbi:MAG: type IV secretion system protein [Alphaproteobacteria bacterium]